MNYKCPIESFSYIDQIIEGVKDEFDNNVYKAVLRAGVQVDKSELIRALQYDRDQYLKGYSDAKAEYDRGVARWSYVDDVINHNQVLICSNCNAASKTSKGLIYPFCPYCGAKMMSPYCGAKMMRRKTNNER